MGEDNIRGYPRGRRYWGTEQRLERIVRALGKGLGWRVDRAMRQGAMALPTTTKSDRRFI